MDDSFFYNSRNYILIFGTVIAKASLLISIENLQVERFFCHTKRTTSELYSWNFLEIFEGDIILEICGHGDLYK